MNPSYAALPLQRLMVDTAAMVRAVVFEARSLADVLPSVGYDSRPGVQALTFHALRWYGAAHSLRLALVPKRPPPAVDALLCTALALLWPPAGPLPYAPHTLVNEAVAAARRVAPAQAGFVNAVLRRFLREQMQHVAAASALPLAQHNHPGWWVQRLRRDWAAQADALMAQAQTPPPMTLRVNSRRCSVPEYRERLAAAGIVAAPPGGASAAPSDPALDPALCAPGALVLAEPCPVQALPGFAEGWVSVQDLSAQRAAPLLLNALAPAPDSSPRILDACAAPGGKTAHLLELCPQAQVLALDSDAQRLSRVESGLQRLGLRAQTRCADASQPDAWWDGKAFDAILLDAPCSASGVVRRHPDIRWLRRDADIASLAALQGRMLDALWPLLKPGGVLLYATCSLFKAEGEDVIDAFMQRQRSPQALRPLPAPGHLLPLAENGPTLPGGAVSALGGDGFFYAVLQRQPP